MSTITRSADHMYTYEGQTYRGVTGVLSVIDKSGPLMSWAARQTAELAVEMTESGILQKMCETPAGRNSAIMAMKDQHSWKRDEAAKLGTEVHNLAERVVHGEKLGILPDTTERRVNAYVDWWTNSGWTLRVAEALLVHTTHSYGGTLDLLARDRDGRTVLADIKTGKGVYSEAVLQLTAYGDAEYIQPPSDNVMVPGQAFKMPHVDRHVILHVTADGVREIEVTVGSLERIAWLACLDLATWRDSVKGKRL